MSDRSIFQYITGAAADQLKMTCLCTKAEALEAITLVYSRLPP